MAAPSRPGKASRSMVTKSRVVPSPPPAFEESFDCFGDDDGDMAACDSVCLGDDDGDMAEDEIKLEEDVGKNKEGVQQSQATSSSVVSNTVNFTEMPKLLDAAIEKYDKDSALRSTVIKTSDSWSRSRQLNLLTKPEKSFLVSSDV